MIEITQEIRDMLKTDPDQYDYAKEHNLNPRELELAVCLFDAKETPCQGCENVVHFGMFPCNCCVRKAKGDFYKPVE